jgi:membrane protein required for colicin V production
VNGFDIALTVLIAIFVLLGLIKGLTRVLIGLGALVAAFLLASHFHRPFAATLTWIDLADEVVKLIAYLLIFFGTMVAGALVAWVVRKLLKAAMLSWADRLAGAAVGLLAATLVAAWLVLPVVAYSPAGERALRDSVLAPYVTVVADVARGLVPAELSESYEEKVEELRRYWRDRWQGTPEEREVRLPSPTDTA